MTTTLKTQALDTPLTDTMTLSHVDSTSAQTWNWLDTNDTHMKVRTPPTADPLAEVPAAAQRIECGAGPEATQWLDAAATQRHVIVVPAQTTGQTVVVNLDAAQGSVAQTTIFARQGSTVSVDVIVAEGVGVAPQDVDTRAFAEENEQVARESAAHNATDTELHTSGHVLRIHAEDGATVHVSLLVALHDNEQYLDSMGIKAEKHARVSIRQYVLGGALSALGTNVTLNGDRSRVDATLRYLVRDQEQLDVGYLVPVQGRHSRAHLDLTGVLAEGARKSLRATIDLKHGCKGSKGAEKETVLVTGNHVENKTLPIILCDEDDVEGSHGAAIGSISPEQLSYLADRGLDEKESLALFTRAIVDDAANSLNATASQAVVTWARDALGDAAATELDDARALRQPEREA